MLRNLLAVIRRRYRCVSSVKSFSWNRLEVEQDTPRQPAVLPTGAAGLLGRGARTEGGITRVVCNPSHSRKKPPGFSRQLFHRVKLGATRSCWQPPRLNCEIWHSASVPEGQAEGKTSWDLLVLKSISFTVPHLYKGNRSEFVKAQMPFLLLYLIRFHLTSVALRDGNSVIRALTLFWILKTLLLL